MSNYIKALRDLLVILVVIGTISLVLSFVTGRDNGEFDADERVASFLQVDDTVGEVVGTDDLDLSDISFNEIDGVDISDTEIETTDAEPNDSDDVEEGASDTTFREGVIEGEGDDQSDASTTVANEERSHVVEAGDTYGCIAEEYYGSFEYWPLIEAANASSGVGFQELELHIGNRLILPATTDQKPASSLCS